MRNTALALATYTRPLTRETAAALPQWLFPGPHSRQIRAATTQVVSVPDYVTAGTPQTVVVLQWQVPDGMIFSMRAIQLLGFVQSWNQASGDLTFNLAVISGGNRNVDFLQSIITELGSNELPFPIGGRLEFEPLDVLQVTATASANVAIGAPNNLFACLWGHIYPAAERLDTN